MFSIRRKLALSLCTFLFCAATAVAVTCPAGNPCLDLNTQTKGSRLPSWGVDSGAANAYAITTLGDIGSGGVLQTGSSFAFIATHANTSASTLAVNGGSAKAIKKNVSTALASGDILLNGVVLVQYDGTNFQLLNNVFSGSISCSQMPALTGDATSSAGSCATTLASVVTAGSCGDSTHSCGLTYDAKGRITGATNNSISGGGGGGSGSFFGLWNFTAPVFANFSWVNQGGATADTTLAGTVYINAPASAGDNIRLLDQALPASSNYTITLGFVSALPDQSFVLAGLVLRDSVSGKLINMCWEAQSAADIQINKYNSPSSFNANYFLHTVSSTWAAPIHFFRVQDNGTNRIWSMSSDGVHFYSLHSEARTDFITPDRVGFQADSANGTWPANITVVHWTATTP